jgi:predicted nucleic acid-binding protein
MENDPEDNKFVDCGIAGQADFLVTQDKHFNILKTIEFPKLSIISTEDFAKLLQ